jgi:hypothetical protein
MGPSTVPCGTPDSTVASFENSPYQNTLQKDLQNLEKWTTNWGMRFKAKKCYMLSLRKKIQGSYKLDGHTLTGFFSNVVNVFLPCKIFLYLYS